MVYDSTAAELADDACLAQFLEDFEQCRIAKEAWTHAAHVAMAGCYLLSRSLEETLDAVKTGIQRFNGHHGGDPSKYHESLTRFWLYLCHAFLQERGLTGSEGVRALVAEFGRRSDLYRKYYSFDVARDGRARVMWIAPDRQHLPGAWRNGSMLISTNRNLLNLNTVHGFLTTSYWAEGISKEAVEKCLRHSMVFGAYERGDQVGMARVVTDFTTFGYLADVFVMPSHRRRGISKWLLECVITHPSLQGFRRWMLVTRDAHTLYEKIGFHAVAAPEKLMEIVKPAIYSRLS